MHSNDSPPPTKTAETAGSTGAASPAEARPETTAPQVDSSMLRALLRNAPGFISWIGPDRLTRYLNRTAYGFSMDDVIGKPYDNLLSPDSARKYDAAMERARTTGKEQNIEFCYDTPNEGRRWNYASLSVLHDEQGEFIGYINIITEITAQKRAEEQLKKIQVDLIEASHRAGMAEVATGVLHNVGNVLNSVNVSACTLVEQVDALHVDLLERTVALMEAQGEGLAEFIASDPKGQKLPTLLTRVAEQLASERLAMRQELQHLMEHIDIIRSTIEAQQSVAKSGEVLEAITLDDLIERTLSMFRIDMERKDIALECSVESHPAMLMDKQSTMQILANLMRNAVEAVSGTAQPRLAVKAGTEGDRLVFEVADNGCGIPAENLTKIFRHGFTTKQSGHGFGLHSSCIAAQAMGGSLTATSEGEGRGASFCLTLPRRHAPAD